MSISNLLNEQLILPNLVGTTKQHIMEEVVEHLATVQKDIHAGELLKALLDARFDFRECRIIAQRAKPWKALLA